MTLLYSFICFYLLIIVTYAYGVISSPGAISIEYGYSGTPVSFILPFKLEHPISPTDYFSIIWPQLLHVSPDKTTVKLSLQTQDGYLIKADIQAISNSITTDSTYYFCLGMRVENSTWFRIKIYPNPSVLLSLVSGLVKMQTVSHFETGFITYDRNMAYGYFYTQIPVILPSLMAISLTTTDTNVKIASAIYYADLTITPTLSSTDGGNFTVSMYYNSAVHLVGSSLYNDFKFIGKCYSNNTVLNQCNIDKQLGTITFSAPSVLASSPIILKVQIQNPIYESSRGLIAYWVNFKTGLLQERGSSDFVFKVDAIDFNSLGVDRVRFLWGIKSSYSDINTTGVHFGIFSSAATNAVGPMNSINIGFSLQKSSPINSLFQVYITLQATGVLEGTIVHNLPAYSADRQVFCSYTYPDLICKNVGAFLNVFNNFRYFVSLKAYYDGATTPATLNTLGNIVIKSIVYREDGTTLLSGVRLFLPFTTTDTFQVVQNTEYLDTTGLHSTTYSLRKTQIVSYNDDLSLSSTGIAVKSFLTSTTNSSSVSVGIIPNLSTNFSSQQLLFFLKVPQDKYSSLNGNNQYEMKVVYNNKVIGFETGTQGRGLDFVGYNSLGSNWTITSSPCHTTNHVVCQKYNDNVTGSQVNNKQLSKYDSSSNPLYGMFSFQCGESPLFDNTKTPTLCTGGDCLTQCNIFQGDFNALAQGKAGVFSMRRVKFISNQFHSQLYADSYLLDFIIVFLNGGSRVSTSLINAYTIEPLKMQNIKAAYVNYYDDGVTYNKGIRIPTMIRIAGGVLLNESRGADAVAVFFDEYTDSKSFYTDSTVSYDIGCSTGACTYYPNKGVKVVQDNWLTSKFVVFENLPTLLNQFSLLVPVVQQLSKPPSSLTLCFLTSDYTVDEVTDLYRVISAYRIYGSGTQSLISQPIPNINSLSVVAPSPAALNIDFNSTSWTHTSYLSSINYGLDLNTAITGATLSNSTLYSNVTPLNLNSINSRYGGGVTITSFMYDIFRVSSSYFKQFTSSVPCTSLSYIYNEVEAGKNLERTGKRVYTVYCAVDSTLDFNSVFSDIVFTNLLMHTVFRKGFPLSTVLAYGISTPPGLLVGYKLETGILNNNEVCTSSHWSPFYPISQGKQRSTFSIVLSSMLKLQSNYNSYSSFQVQLTLPSASITSASVLSFSNVCDSKISQIQCTIAPTASYLVYKLTFSIKAGITTPVEFNTISFDIYGISTTNFSASISNYNVKVILPQSQGGFLQTFGTDFTGVTTTYAACDGIFRVSASSYSPYMTITNLKLETSSKTVKGQWGFKMGFIFRDAFYSTSQIEVSLGFLSAASSVWKNRNNLHCQVWDNWNPLTNSITDILALDLSTLWKSISYASYPTLVLTPKAEIPTPNIYSFQLICKGGAMPDGSSTGTSISAVWKDSAAVVQSTQTPINYPLTLLPVLIYTTPITLLYKRFNNQGLTAFYTFQYTLDTTLSPDSRIQIEFPYHLTLVSTSLECYTRLTESASTNDANANQAYCGLQAHNRIQLWFNLYAVAGTVVYIDIFGVHQPLVADLSANSVISFSTDINNLFSDGVYSYGEIADTTTTAAPALLSLVSISVTPLVLQSLQTITITLISSLNMFIAARSVYVQFPTSYAIWNRRGASLPIAVQCFFRSLLTSTTTNRATACTFISKSVLKIDIAAHSNVALENYQIQLLNIYSPVEIDGDYQNSVMFGVFLTTDATEMTRSHYSYISSSRQIVFNTLNTTVVGLDWYDNYNQLSLVDTGRPLVINLGYFNSLVEIRSHNYPTIFGTNVRFIESSISVNPLSILSKEADGSLMAVTSYTADLGLTGSKFMLAATALTGSTTSVVNFQKLDDTSNFLYGYVPPLNLVISSAKCSLMPKYTTYTLPIGGSTLPIILDASKCLPINNISISLQFSTAASELQASADLTNSLLTSTNTIDGKYYFVIRHYSGTLVASNTITVNFLISGSEAAYYAPIPSVTLSMIDSTIISIPTANMLTGQPAVINSTSVSFTVQCSSPSFIYWTIGLVPTIIWMTALDIQASILSSGRGGLLSNYSQPYDSSYRVYGVTYSTVSNEVVRVQVDNLKSNSFYQFKYYCINQLGKSSEGQSTNFTSYNNFAVLTEILLKFKAPLTFGQINSLACSISQTMLIPYYRVLTSSISSCQTQPKVFYKDSTVQLVEQPDALGNYVYRLYVQPDYTILNDQTNEKVRLALADPTYSSKLLSKTVNGTSLPHLLQIQKQTPPSIIQQLYNSQIPALKVISITSDHDSVELTATITNVHGYIVAAILKGTFNPLVLSLPSPANIKQGTLSLSQNFDAVQMLYTSLNYSSKITFNGLEKLKDYVLCYFASEDNPAYSSISSSVACVNTTTQDIYTIVVDFSPSTQCTILVLLIVTFVIL